MCARAPKKRIVDSLLGSSRLSFRIAVSLVPCLNEEGPLREALLPQVAAAIPLRICLAAGALGRRSRSTSAPRAARNLGLKCTEGI